MRRHRSRGRARMTQRKRVFWIRNSGSISVAGPAFATIPKSVPLFDPLELLPDQANQRADIRDITVHRQKLNIAAVIDVSNDTTSTGDKSIAYWGIYLGNRNDGARAASFSAPDDARTDWLDCWIDTQDRNPIQPILPTGLWQPEMRAVRDVKTKRKMQSQDLMYISTTVFPFVPGTNIDGDWLYIAQWQYSALISVS